MSEESEGHPSPWLTKSLSPAAPADEPEAPFIGGRIPNPRSVRVARNSWQQDALQERRAAQPMPRVQTRRMGSSCPPLSEPKTPRPRFRATGLHLDLLRSPALTFRLYFYLFPLLVLAHIPVQTFLDFNALFLLVQIVQFPNPDAPGVSGSKKNWALAAAAYIACWVVWIVPVVIVYELVYSFFRRWRVKRPVMLPLYLSSPAFNYVSMTSFTNFCFMQHLRWSAFVGEDGSWRDGLAETFYLYSQNLPTVALLLPRAGLALSLMLAFSVPDAGFVALADAGLNRRDKTFFRIHDGTLTSYAHGVLYANVAWALWRVIVLLVSWIGLWILSGAGCAGLCGPRNRWEEDAAEKTLSVYSDNVSALESLPWKWREATFLRVQTAFEFCLTLKPRWSRSEKAPEDTTEPISPSFPFTPPPARGIVLSGTFGDMIPKIVKRPSKDVQDDAQGPLTRLPYPFAGPSAQRSSQDMVPFPPSPRPSAEQRTTRDSPDGQEEVEDDAYQSTGTGTGSSDDPAVRTSASMSSLGQPIVSRYPFRFRSSTHGSSQSNTHSHSQSASSGPRRSVLSHSSGSYSASPSSFIGPDPFGLPLPPRHPQAPVRGRSRAGTVPMPSVATSGSGSGSGSSIGMPPPTPLDFPRRPRASTVSRATSSGSGSDLQPRSSSPQPQPGLNPNESYGDAESVSAGSHEHDGEREDQLGLLMGNSASSSPRTSLGALRQRASNLSLSSWVQQRRMTRYSGSNSGSGSGSHSRAQSHSGSASSSGRSRAGSLSVVRSRAQSLLQNLGGAPSFDSAAMRLRASSSVGRLEDISDSEHARARVASSANTHSRSGSGSDGLLSDVENNTFGHPLRPHLPAPSPVPESPLEHP